MNKEDFEDVINELINIQPNKIKKYTIVINDDKPLFNKKDFDTIEGKPQYFELDNNGRSNGAIAIISKNTLPLITKRKLKYPEPSNWNKAFENKKLFEKCHIIAYSLSAKLANPKNIFIGTVKLNKSYMKKVENEVKKHINDKSVKILYRVTVKYKDTNKIPIGVLIEAQSIDDSYSVCRFCYNIQRGKNFRYSNGMIVGEQQIWSKVVQTVANKIARKNNRKSGYINYTINTKTKIFHLYDNDCKQLQNAEHKNIQETTATEKDLLAIGLKYCKNCVKDK